MSDSDYTTEHWFPVAGYEDLYEVSDHGRVRSLDRIVTYINRWGTFTTRLSPGQIMMPHKKRYNMSIALCEQTKKRFFFVHRLVLEAFIGPCPLGQECCHNDGNAYNNHLSNLRWDSPKNNSADRLLHGTQPCGEKSHLAKLTNGDVREIRQSLALQKSHKQPLLAFMA